MKEGRNETMEGKEGKGRKMREGRCVKEGEGRKDQKEKKGR